jgi:cytochrome c biogenesis protein CcdA
MFDANLTLGVVIGAALADSINPCVFGVLIFLLAFLTRVFKSRRRMLLGGLLYSLVVYATYLALGFGIIGVAVSLSVANGFYYVAAIIAIIAGLLEIKDFFWYGKGLTLQMFPGGAARLKMYTKKIEKLQRAHPHMSLLFVGLLGVFVVLVELPCTGAPYFAVLALLAKGNYAVAVPYLLLYNFVFILPLLFIIALVYFGKGKGLEAWRKRHRGAMRLGIGLFLIALGAYMIYSVLLLG